MTSWEVMTVAKRRPGGVHSDTTGGHAARFYWSKGHTSVRDLVARQQVEIPTIVRIAAAYRQRSSAHPVDFREGTVRFILFTVYIYLRFSWRRSTVVERRSLTSELSLSCA